MEYINEMLMLSSKLNQNQINDILTKIKESFPEDNVSKEVLDFIYNLLK